MRRGQGLGFLGFRVLFQTFWRKEGRVNDEMSGASWMTRLKSHLPSRRSKASSRVRYSVVVRLYVVA